eukprot:769009-Prymnesium_polylepis.1
MGKTALPNNVLVSIPTASPALPTLASTLLSFEGPGTRVQLQRPAPGQLQARAFLLKAVTVTLGQSTLSQRFCPPGPIDSDLAGLAFERSPGSR